MTESCCPRIGSDGTTRAGRSRRGPLRGWSRLPPCLSPRSYQDHGTLPPTACALVVLLCLGRLPSGARTHSRRLRPARCRGRVRCWRRRKDNQRANPRWCLHHTFAYTTSWLGMNQRSRKQLSTTTHPEPPGVGRADPPPAAGRPRHRLTNWYATTTSPSTTLAHMMCHPRLLDRSSSLTI